MYFQVVLYAHDCLCSKIPISNNKYMQKAGEPENDAGFLRVIIIAALHVAS